MVLRFLPEILVPLMGLVLPIVGMSLFFLYIDWDGADKREGDLDRSPIPSDSLAQKPEEIALAESKIVQPEIQEPEFAEAERKAPDRAILEPEAPIPEPEPEAQALDLVTDKPENAVLEALEPQTPDLIMAEPETSDLVIPEPESSIAEPETSDLVIPEPEESIAATPEPEAQMLTSSEPDTPDSETLEAQIEKPDLRTSEPEVLDQAPISAPETLSRPTVFDGLRPAFGVPAASFQENRPAAIASVDITPVTTLQDIPEDAFDDKPFDLDAILSEDPQWYPEPYPARK
jgi:photosystem I reaction center subunit VIII